ncbi:DNA polymerase III subunit delta' [Piscinibacter sp. XHJ-5]|uniref:DNA polymerase III subunit delta' n=1 Tax=Piscinibacter sp. XHJ-5 TaxID=3037797 RepID=UPI0024535322|nr:DNA polymerase III subunit delta' [Piscinibacter sp. XHJ-5]
MVGPDGALPLPWLEAPLRRALATQRAHALLVHGPQGVGQFELALILAQAWLCEAAHAARPCGQCASCRLVQARSHSDLLVLLPEALREMLGWSASGDEAEGTDDKGGKRKPSKEIRVDEVRQAIAFAQTTSARGRGKVVVIHPAERMNGISANALLKTLEEPPGEARLVLSSAAPDALLPTIRSRCQALVLDLPQPALASRWLSERSVAQPDVLLAATGGQPQDALQWQEEGIDARQWLALPQQMARGEVGALGAWPLPRVVDMLLKLCHDAMRMAAGAAPRYFPPSAMPAAASLAALSAWARTLQEAALNAEHPWNAGLLVESLTHQAQEALGSRP